MSTQISSDVAHELAHTVQLAFRKIVMSAPDVTKSNVGSLTKLYEAVLGSVRDALVSELRDQSNRLFPRYRLPDELWCMIWRQLSLDGRIHVSHVCHDWRTLALSSPALWSDLHFVTSRHDQDYCDCHDCEDFRHHTECTNCDNEWSSGSSNLRTILEVLPRSLAHPLSLTICVQLPEGSEPDRSELNTLARALRTQINRLRTLHCDISFEEPLADFMSHVKVFPALTSLTCEISSAVEDGLLPEDSSFPSLQTMDLRGDIPMNIGIRAPPTVRNLACDYTSSLQFTGVLSAFPHLSTLHVRMRSLSTEFSADIRGLAKTIACVTVSDVFVHDAQAVLDMFDEPTRPNFTLCCAEGTRGALLAFATLHEGVHLSCEIHEGHEGPVRLIATDAHQRMRTLYCHGRDGRNVWDHLFPTSLHSVTLDLRLPYVTLADFLTRTPDTRELVLVLPGPNDIAAFVTRVTNDSLQSTPAFDALRFKSSPGPRVVVSAEILTTILCWLQAPLPLRTVVFDCGVIYDGAAGDTSDVVGEIVTVPS
ncbi:hypothetical protein EXIGLDRAFT_830195 [Exidia glandulosa HHB12029]|uniref:F-box domain-containing protein n=1 Tax=Exidia glandulosa HHB12029 TaxID=1314781 RepID=A0A165NUB0_EXIGL|nr:hypothetical protein EXIGLDRAFT_830195 [Exidia glandulosa HHB12029]